MLRIADLQKQARTRTRKVTFTPCVMSHRGELSPDFIRLIERLADKKRALTRGTKGEIDGYTPSRAAADFRTRLKDSLAVSLAWGWGRQLRATGFSRFGGS